jgi:hypothetical protein
VSDGIMVTGSQRQESVFKSTGEHSNLVVNSAHSNIYLPTIGLERNSTRLGEVRLQRASNADNYSSFSESEMVMGTTTSTPTSLQMNGNRKLVIDTNGTTNIIGDISISQAAYIQRFNRINSFYEYVKDGPYTSSAATVSVIRQFHDAANWCNGGILVEITCHGYSTSEYDHAIYFVRYGYGGNSIAIDTRMSPITNRITAPYWGSAINISGNDYYRDLFFDTQAYRSYKIVLKTSMAPTTNSTGAGQGNYVYLFGY